jgi:hypothetical protein
MKYFIIIALMMFPTFAQANALCEAYASLASQVMDYRVAGYSEAEMQFIVDSRIQDDGLEPDVQFAIAVLPEQAYRFPTANPEAFATQVYDDCVK